MRKNFHFWVFCKYIHIPLICSSRHIYAVHSYAPVSSFVALILAPVAQWIERLFPKETVVGSTPIRSTSFLPFAYGIASLSTSRTPPRDLSNFTSTRKRRYRDVVNDDGERLKIFRLFFAAFVLHEIAET